jgi:hypothetical protein
MRSRVANQTTRRIRAIHRSYPSNNMNSLVTVYYQLSVSRYIQKQALAHPYTQHLSLLTPRPYFPKIESHSRPKSPSLLNTLLQTTSIQNPSSAKSPLKVQLCIDQSGVHKYAEISSSSIPGTSRTRRHRVPGAHMHVSKSSDCGSIQMQTEP